MSSYPPLDKYGYPVGSPISQKGNEVTSQVPWQFGVNQQIQARQVKVSRANVFSPFRLSEKSSASGATGNGTTLNFTTQLTPNAPHANEVNFAIPYVAIYWNNAGDGTAQIFPYNGSGVPGTAFTIQAGYDWHLFSSGTPGSVASSFTGKITNNSMGNGTVQLVTQWLYIDFNTGSASNT